MLKKIKSDWPLLLVPLLLVFIWFKDGFLIAKAEEGIPFYEPIRIFSIYRNYWFDYGLGFPNTFYLPRLGFFLFASFFAFIGLPSFLVQSFVFYLIFLIPLLSVKYLLKEVNKETSDEVSTIAAIFYLLNLYTFTQIIQRMVYPLFIQWSYLPLSLLLWIRFINKANIYNLSVFIISGMVFSMAFGIPSGVLVLWIPLFIYSVFIYVNSKFSFRVVFSSFVGLVSFSISNIWWLYPQYKLASISFSERLSTNLNLSSLIEVNQYFTYLDIFFLRQKFLFGETFVWYEFYKQNTVQFLSLMAFILVIIGLINSYKKNIFVILLFLISLFLVKGTLPPLGIEFYSFLFEKFPFTQVFRNPYEKLGIIYVLSYSFFFSIGINSALKNNFIRLCFYGLFFIFLVKPMWDGSIWVNAKVCVPGYYELANRDLKQIEGRVLRLPFLNGAEVEYDWRYVGGAHAEQLYDVTILDKNFDIAGYDDFYPLIAEYLNDKNFINIAYISNIQGILLNEDLVTKRFFKNDFKQSQELLNNSDIFTKLSEFESLSIYKNSEPNNYAYIANNLVAVEDLKKAFDYFVSENFSRTDAVLVNQQNKDKFALQETNVPMYNIRKLNSSHYNIEISNADSPYILVLNQNFHPYWKAKIFSEEINQHFEVNGYANGWFVDKKGTYTINIKFAVWPWE